MEAELAVYRCKFCGRNFREGRQLGGHIRQAHPEGRITEGKLRDEGELAADILHRWARGEKPYDAVVTLKVHPEFVRGVINGFRLLQEDWKKDKPQEDYDTATQNATGTSVSNILKGLRDVG